ncbi:MAG TPA: hypothetical protein VFA24_04910 [Gaiellaceae bacterium]|nr:hypothetical protein [Gaiellaceae bacterium]
MRADAGADEIRRLLTDPNPAVEDATNALAAAIRNGRTVRGSGRASVRFAIPAAGARAVASLRSALLDVRRQVAAVTTDRRDAQQQVLAALALLDASLALFARSLGTTGNARMATLAHAAEAERTRAEAALTAAIRGLG